MNAKVGENAYYPIGLDVHTGIAASPANKYIGSKTDEDASTVEEQIASENKFERILAAS